jgi:two-component system cell cycle response regulator
MGTEETSRREGDLSGHALMLLKSEGAALSCVVAGLVVVCISRGSIWLYLGVGVALCGFVRGRVLAMQSRKEREELQGRLQTAIEVETALREEMQVMEDFVSSLKEFDDETPRLKAEIEEQNEALSTANARLETLATTDPLTTLFNHRALVEELDREVARATTTGRRFAVLFIDLDHFKSLNDTFGHQAGDETLVELANLLRSTLSPASVAGRWGGEEFLTILPETDADRGLRAAEALRAAIARHPFVSGEAGRLTCSIGLAVYPDDADTSNDLVAVADSAMYAAKRLGRNQVRAAADPAVGALERVHNRSDLREDATLAGTVEAMAVLVAARDRYAGEHYQAVVSLTTGMAIRLGMSLKEMQLVEMAARLHDIGKVAVPDSVLVKEGAPLTDEEWRILRRHSVIGADVVAHVPALRPLAPIIRSHHERWDGRGYPDGLVGEEIPLGARIVAVAGAYRALTADRPYQQGRTPEYALDELHRCAGSQFDPTVVDALADELAGQRMMQVEAVQVAG